MPDIKQRENYLRLLQMRFGLIVFGIILGLLILELSLNLLHILIRYKDARHNVSSAKNAYNVLCIGDSFTYGTGVEQGYNYPSQLQRILEERHPDKKFNVTNLGLPGWNSSQMLNMLPENLSRYSPRCVIIWAGVDNCWNIKDSNYFLFVNKMNPYLFLKRLDCYLLEFRVYKLFKICKMNLMHKIKAKESKTPEEETLMSREEHRFLESAEEDIINNKDKSVVLEKLKMAYRHNKDYQRAILLFKKYYPWKEFSQMTTDFFTAVGNENELAKIKRERLYRCAVALSGVLDFNIDWASYDKIIFDRLLQYDLGRMIQIARGRGIDLILLTYSSDNMERGSDNDIIRRIAKKYNIPCVDTVPIFDELLKKYPVSDYLLRDGHFNNNGYKVVAEAVYKKFISDIYR